MTLYDLASKFTSLKNAVLQIPPIEAKTRELTSNVPWGSKRSEMMDVAEGTNHFDERKLVMKVIWERIGDKDNARHIQKGLQLLEFLIANGSDSVAENAKDYLSDITDLKHYRHRDDNGKDVGGSVRELAEKVSGILRSEKEIDKVRQEARQARSKFQGISRDESRYSKRSEERDPSPKRKDSEEEYRAKPKKQERKRDSFEDTDFPEEKVEAKTHVPEKKKVEVEKVPEKKKENLFDDFFGNNGKSIDPFGPTTTVKAPTHDDFFKGTGNNGNQNVNDDFFNPRGTKTAPPPTQDFDVKFDDDDSFTSFQGVKKDPKDELMDFTKGLVDISLKTEKVHHKEEPKKEEKKTVLKSAPVMGRDAPWERPVVNTPPVKTSPGPIYNQPVNNFPINNYPPNNNGFNPNVRPNNTGFNPNGFNNPNMNNGGFNNNNLGGFNNGFNPNPNINNGFNPNNNNPNNFRF